MTMTVGKITFGPVTGNPLAGRRPLSGGGGELKYDRVVVDMKVSEMHACNCIGPQPGETKCPCQLRGEAEKGQRMVRDGVIINGVEYVLVPKPK